MQCGKSPTWSNSWNVAIQDTSLLIIKMSTCELYWHVALIYNLCASSANQWVMWYPLSLSLSLCVRFALSTVTIIILSFSLGMNVTMMMDVECEQKRAPSTSSSTYSSSCDRLDRLLDTQEIEAAETLAQLAMPDTHSANKWCNKRATIRVTRESPTHDSDLSRSPSPLGPGVRFLLLFLFTLIALFQPNFNAHHFTITNSNTFYFFLLLNQSIILFYIFRQTQLHKYENSIMSFMCKMTVSVST